MLETEEWWMLKELRNAGKSLRAISRETGYDRRTVKKYLKTGEKPSYKRRSSKTSLLDPYKPHIRDAVVRLDLQATRIFRDIQKMGYSGQYTILKEYIRPFRVEHSLEAVYRYETKPGVQSQVDFDPICKIEIDGELKKLYCFNFILGFSRNRFTQFTVDPSTEEVLRLLMAAFQYFGGYTDEILFDNMKQIVITRAIRYEDIKWNPMFRDFFEHYDFTPRLCKPGRAQTKGKVENQVKLVQNDFFKGLDFSGLADLNDKALAWCAEVNGRTHRTTGAIPKEKLSEEKLKSFLAKPPYQIIRVEYRKITRDCFISYLGNRYSVPWRYAGRQARILVKNGRLLVEVCGEAICEHEARPGNGTTVRVKEHFDGLLKETRGRNLRAHLLRTLKLPGMPDVERRPLSVYEDMSSLSGGIDG